MMFGIGKKKKKLNVDNIIPKWEMNFNLSDLENYSFESLVELVKYYDDYLKKTT